MGASIASKKGNCQTNCLSFVQGTSLSGRNLSGRRSPAGPHITLAVLAVFCGLASSASAQSNQASPIGTNLGGINYYTTAQPFLNIFKTGSGWFGRTTGGTVYNEVQGAFNLDVNGYPQTMAGIGPAAGQNFSEIDALLLRGLGPQNVDGSETAPFYSSGNYVLLYSGTATFNFYYDCVNSNIVSSAPGRIVINIPQPSDAGCQINISSMGSNYPNNMAFVYSPDSTGTNFGTNETAYNNGKIFNPNYVSSIVQFRTLRFMDWMEANNTVQTNWSGRPTPTQAFWGIWSSPGNVDPMPQGVPVEVMVALCNEINADGWFNMPPLSTDDYVAQFATLVHNGGVDSNGRAWAGLASNLKAYVEYGNEIWNSGALSTFNDLVTLGEAAFPNYDTTWGAGFYYAILRAVQNGATWKTVWGTDAGRVIRVAAGQDGYPARNQFILSFTAGMYGGNASNFNGTVAQNVEVFATAPYFGYPVPDSFTLDQLFQEITSGGLVSGAYPGGMIKQALDYAASDHSVAAAASLPLVFYEGGQTLVDYSGTDTALQSLYLAANRDSRMGTAYSTYLSGLKNVGGQLFNNFIDFSPYSKWGYWGALENVLQTSSPKNDALKSFISANPCWWSGCSSTSNSASPSPSPPTVPTGLVDSVMSSTQIAISWHASAAGSSYPVAGYHVFRNGNKVADTGSPSYQDTGLSAGTTYTYTVSAYDTAGNSSALSSPVSAAIPSPPAVNISSPRNGTLIKGNGSVNIAASASDGNGVKSITIMGDGNVLMTCSGVTSCTTNWQGKMISQGTHVITVAATDAFGLQSTTSVSVAAIK